MQMSAFNIRSLLFHNTKDRYYEMDDEMINVTYTDLDNSLATLYDL
jgi:hypothetical protein